jgi:hypothetical protein
MEAVMSRDRGKCDITQQKQFLRVKDESKKENEKDTSDAFI